MAVSKVFSLSMVVVALLFGLAVAESPSAAPAPSHSSKINPPIQSPSAPTPKPSPVPSNETAPSPAVSSPPPTRPSHAPSTAPAPSPATKSHAPTPAAFSPPAPPPSAPSPSPTRAAVSPSSGGDDLSAADASEEDSKSGGVLNKAGLSAASVAVFLAVALVA